ncbi:hypothetical protein RXV94_09530 [Yeosuana sp. MJ-SS3]|uniref:Lipoprotein n=1 Tax=Gilvirhabdus luticola TaxID=3079858 RepID=A0ABU3U7L6_9FLAO|nr:hypothetical protein [Yeosuana sp. MJ-SS3]MDU8886399.1 hypothetical protein [Yeosuana sp. MJ-SS3]
MKKHVLFISILTLIFFGCSNNESEPLQETQQREFYSKMVKDFIASDDFKNYFNHNFKNSSTAQARSSNSGGNGNGVWFIENAEGAFWSIGIRNDNDTPDFPDDDFTEKVVFLAGKPSDIKVFKSGYAMAQSSSNNAFCFVIDFSDFSFLGNDCYDKKGHFNMKVSGNLMVDEAPWGTFYFIEYDSIFLHANNITINNESITYDEETGEPLYCNGDATIEKSVSLKLMGDGDGPLEGRIDIE